MTKIDKISVAITREQHAKIKAAVERGDYATTSEVIRTALREWELKEELRRIEASASASSGTRASPAGRPANAPLTTSSMKPRPALQKSKAAE